MNGVHATAQTVRRWKDEEEPVEEKEEEEEEEEAAFPPHPFLLYIHLGDH
jgi:hypothetical protein